MIWTPEPERAVCPFCHKGVYSDEPHYIEPFWQWPIHQECWIGPMPQLSCDVCLGAMHPGEHNIFVVLDALHGEFVHARCNTHTNARTYPFGPQPQEKG